MDSTLKYINRAEDGIKIRRKEGQESPTYVVELNIILVRLLQITTNKNKYTTLQTLLQEYV